MNKTYKTIDQVQYYHFSRKYRHSIPHNIIKETACIWNKRQPFRMVQKLFK